MLYFGEPVAVPDPDLAAGGGSLPQKIILPLRASVWSKEIKRQGGEAPWAPPLDPPLSRASINVLAYITRMRDTPTRVHFLHAFSNTVAD